MKTNPVNHMNTTQIPQLHKHSAIISAFQLSFLPNWMKKSIIIQQEVESAIKETERMLGEEKTKDLVIQFQNQAYANPNVVNHQYMIRKLYDARESALHDR
jgi:hypothetical protein